MAEIVIMSMTENTSINIAIDEYIDYLVASYKSGLLPNNRYVIGQFTEFWQNTRNQYQ